jgi:hypothetical protein
LKAAADSKMKWGPEKIHAVFRNVDHAYTGRINHSTTNTVLLALDIRGAEDEKIN